MSEIKVGSRVRVTQQYVDNVGEMFKAEARKLVGEEGTARKFKTAIWAVDLDKGPHPRGVNWLFYGNELEVIS